MKRFLGWLLVVVFSAGMVGCENESELERRLRESKAQDAEQQRQDLQWAVDKARQDLHALRVKEEQRRGR